MTEQPSPLNPFADGSSAQPVIVAECVSGSSTTGREAYNIVSDTVAGLNVRKSDNLFQLKVILVCVLLGVPIGGVAGAMLSDGGNRAAGAVAGGIGLGFAGVVLGLFGSGIYLMVYRTVRHLKGKHD
jgi:hypothetical protein